MKFRKKPVVIEATQWFKNGDHPHALMQGGQEREHISSADCWCHPEAAHVDPDTGATVYVHKSVQ